MAQDNRVCRDPGFKCRNPKPNVTTGTSTQRKPSLFSRSFFFLPLLSPATDSACETSSHRSRVRSILAKRRAHRRARKSQCVQLLRTFHKIQGWVKGKFPNANTQHARNARETFLSNIPLTQFPRCTHINFTTA